MESSDEDGSNGSSNNSCSDDSLFILHSQSED